MFLGKIFYPHKSKGLEKFWLENNLLFNSLFAACISFII